MTIFFIWGERWGLVTFRDPEKTSLKTSFSRVYFLATRHRRVSPTKVVSSAHIITSNKYNLAKARLYLFGANDGG